LKTKKGKFGGGNSFLKKIMVVFVIYFLLLSIAQASGIVTRCGYIEEINLKGLQIVVDGEIYRLSKRTSVSLHNRNASLFDVKEGDFVILSVEKNKNIVKHILIQNNFLE